MPKPTIIESLIGRKLCGPNIEIANGLHTIKCLTVGDLRKMLAEHPEIPDDNLLLVSVYETVCKVTSIDTFLHGALTFDFH